MRHASCRRIPKLEGLFVDKRERLQQTHGYMRLLKKQVLHV
jgi:hypothetical protein